METSELVEHSSVVEMYDYHKGRTGCGDVAAAVLTLAEVIRRAPADLATSIENGLDAVSSFSVRLSGETVGACGDRLDSVARVGASKPTPSAGSNTPFGTKPGTSTKPADGEGANGRPERGRSDRSHTGLRVLDDFLPAEETKQLAEFLGSVGVRIEDKPKMQELLTLVVYYVTRVRKTKCSQDHIHTVLKKIGVATPADLGARLRDVGRRLRYINPSNGKDVQLTMKGENWVDIELPKRKAGAKG
jgi:hypothetical protein